MIHSQKTLNSSSEFFELESTDSVEEIKTSHQPVLKEFTFKQDSTFIDTTSKTEISYYRLNEAMKFVEYKYKFADPILEYRSMQILFLDSLANDKQLKIDEYKNHAIPELEKIVLNKDSTITNQNSIFGLKEASYEAKIDKLKTDKLLWGLGGTVLGSLIITLIAIFI